MRDGEPRLKLNAGEISALLHAADHINATAFDLSTEDGTKNAARYRSAIMKLRAKHIRIERAAASPSYKGKCDVQP
jgi:hypothetical protein